MAAAGPNRDAWIDAVPAWDDRPRHSASAPVGFGDPMSALGSPASASGATAPGSWPAPWCSNSGDVGCVAGTGGVVGPHPAPAPPPHPAQEEGGRLRTENSAPQLPPLEPLLAGRVGAKTPVTPPARMQEPRQCKLRREGS